jgi:NAD(P)-dependent dehydrogenase (short-subunit alcohol dehydrogenase family)
MIVADGGSAVAVRVDHTRDAEVTALFERIAQEHGRLDVLVNGVAGEDPLLGEWTSFWKTDLTHAEHALRQSLLSHIITAKHAAPLMIKKRRGLIVEVVEGDLLFSSGNVVGQLVKFALKGFVSTMAEELRTHKVAALAITPGYLRSEAMLDHFGVSERNWRDAAKKDPNFLHSESPLFVGRAVAALAGDRRILERSGDLTSSWAVAREFGLTDADGSRPDFGRHLEQSLMSSMKWLRDGYARHVAWLDRLAERGRTYLSAVPV